MCEIGAINNVSDYSQFEWDIPDLLPKERQYFSLCSPEFSFAGCTCKFGVSSRVAGYSGFLSLRLRVKEKTKNQDFTYTLACKKSNGTLEHVKSYEHIAAEDDLYCPFISIDELVNPNSKLLTSGTLTILCRMERAAPFRAVWKHSAHMMPKQRNSNHEPSCAFSDLQILSSDLRHFFDGQKRCDVTIKVRDKEFRCHRAVLMARCPNYFCPMFEHDTKETQEGVVEERDCDPDSFEKFLFYLYTGKVENVTFQEALHLYVTADRYLVPELKSFCGEHLVQNLTPENFCDAAVLAENYGDATQFRSSAQAYFNRNFGDIFQTDEWESLLEANPKLANKLLRRMRSAVKVIEVTNTV